MASSTPLRGARSRGAYPHRVASRIRPPVAPMLARLVRELPIGPMSYEPKWDGFRCIAFAGSEGVDLRSRHDRPLARYFPEIVAGFEAVLASRTGAPGGPWFVLDGEILLADRADGAAEAGSLGFAALMSRLHPAATR